MSIKLQPPRRQGAAIVTIALTTAFTAFMILATSTLASLASQAIAGEYSTVDILATPSADQHVSKVEGLQGVTTQWQMAESLAVVVKDGAQTTNSMFSTDGDYVDMKVAKPGNDPSIALSSGELPRTADEVVVPVGLALDRHLAVGDSIVVQGQNSSARTLKITGITANTAEDVLKVPSMVLTIDGIKAFDEAPGFTPSYPIAMRVSSGTSIDALAKTIEAKGFSVQTRSDFEKAQHYMYNQMLISLGLLFGTFIAIAAVTSAIVVSNSFSVTVAQRRKSFALLRALGSTRGQVIGLVIRDSLVVGVIGSVLGILGAYVAMSVLLYIVGQWRHVALPPVADFNLLAIALPLLLGVGMTLAAGLLPAIGASRVSPLEAMRPVEASTSSSSGILRAVLSLIIVLFGLLLLCGALALALVEPNSTRKTIAVLASFLGGLLIVGGVLLGLPAIVPVMMKLAAAILKPIGGIPARFAAINAVRHPRRTAATMGALVIGAGLMSMMAVGAHTANQSLVADLATREPVDVVASGPGMSAKNLDQIRAVVGIKTAVEIDSFDLDLASAGITAKEKMTIIGVDPATFASVVNRPEIAQSVHEGELLLGKERAKQFGLHNGQKLSVTSESGEKAELTVRVSGNLSLTLTTQSTLKQITSAPNYGVAAAFRSPDDPARKDASSFTIASQVLGTLPQEPGAVTYRNTPGVMREIYAQVINAMLIFVVVLLAIAVVVAMVGVANTLALSVVERSGENALLRALGASKRHIMAMLAWEGALLSLGGTLIGVILGIVFGLVGVRIVLPAGTEFVPSIPWLQLMGVLVLTLVAGVLASVLPGRTASKVEPAAALAVRE